MQLAPGALRRAAVPAVAAVPLAVVSPYAALAAVALAVGVLGFFRDPERTPPRSGVLAPADGRVSVVREEGDRVRVGVFMNVTDVHVNRAPLAGAVRDVTHEPGAHRPAFTKDSDRNEKVRIDVDGPHDHEVVLIAGWFARRINPYVAAGEDLERGQRIGHIDFGSRADVILPGVAPGDVLVEKGETVRAGESVLVGETALVDDDAPSDD
ncbi:phosphatidylserine decarboxylase [Halobacteriales archaeon QS_1_68_20]|nr:MAG: phosphatidylserine decarboxylase [Halobacteriales archaeon QS_1_68_20]